MLTGIRSLVGSPQLTHIVDVDKGPGSTIKGIATLDSQLFVLRQQHVTVYDTTDFTEVDQIKVSASWQLTSLVASQYHNCLYAGDNSPKRIHRVDLSKRSVTCQRIESLTLTGPDSKSKLWVRSG